MFARSIFIIFLTFFFASAVLANETALVGEAPDADSTPTDQSSGQEEQKNNTNPDTPENKSVSAQDDPSDPFCEGIIDAAREKRYYLKQEELKALLASVNKQLSLLEEKKTDYEQWVRRREDFANRATKNLVEIYATMKPEAAAARMAEIESDLAASLLLAITPRQASSILNEMDEKIAASLTSLMAASVRKKDPS